MLKEIGKEKHYPDNGGHQVKSWENKLLREGFVSSNGDFAHTMRRRVLRTLVDGKKNKS